MNQLGHMATGAAIGRACPNALTALLAGITMHGLMDVLPHREIDDEPFEMASAAVGVAILGGAFGPLSPITVGAIGGMLPDLEHVIPKPAGAGLVYPTHRFESLHTSDTKGSMPVWMQVALGGFLLGWAMFRGVLSRLDSETAARPS